MQISFQSTIARSSRYRADVDGLRALAVVPVVLYHAKVAGFSGGFVGVDVFYVISGYLITSLILKDEERGRFSFASFYERRIRRIFPALFGVICFCTIVATILLAPKDFLAFGKSMLAMTFFATNILFARDTGDAGYFGRTAENYSLLHTWSLSVEEQFYIFFPTILLLCTRRAKRGAKSLLVIIALISFAICLWETKHRPVSAFYGFIPRAWELLLGALLAMRIVPHLDRRILRELLGVIGIAMLAWAVFGFTDDTVFPGISVLLPCLGTCMVIYGGESGPSWAKSVLSFGPFVFIGVISYSLYLWHWPLIVFTRYFSAADLTGRQKLIVISCSVLLAFISYEFIEAPFRGANSQFNRREIFLLGACATGVTACIALAICVQHGFPGRYDARIQHLVAENAKREDDFLAVCGNWKKEIHGMEDISFCSLGPTSERKVMFWGDSHVQQLYPLLAKLYEQGDLHNRGVLIAVANGCAPVERLNNIRTGYHCDSFAHFAMLRAEEKDIDTVFIGFSTWWYGYSSQCPSLDGRCIQSISPAEVEQRFIQEFGEHLAKLKGDGKHVIVSLPFPIYDRSIPDVEIRNALFGKFGLQWQAKDITSPVLRNEIESVAREKGAEVFDPRHALCVNENCLTQVDGVSIYKDDNHIAASQVDILEDDLRQALN